MMYDYFDQIYGFTHCDFNSFINPIDNRSCIPCPANTYSLDQPAITCYDVGSADIPEYLSTKAEFIQILQKESMNVGLIITASILSIGIFIFAIIFVILVRKK